MATINQNLGELLPIKESSNGQAVNARDLHSFLEIGRDFSTWMKDQIQRCDLTENVDFQLLSQNGEQTGRGGHNRIEYALSINAAKEISMMSQTEKGKEARRYFIACETKLKEIALQNLPSYQINDPVKRAETWIEEEKERQRLALEVKQQQEQIMVNAPKVLFADAVVASDSCILIGKLANVLKQNGIEIGQNRLFKWMRENGYLCKDGERRNQPTQRAMEMELFEVSYNTIVRADRTFQTITTKVTGKGQMYFINKFLNAKGMGGVRHAS